MQVFQIHLMGGIYILLGIFHFTHKGFYKPIMPKFLSAHLLLIYLSGITEIILEFGVLY